MSKWGTYLTVTLVGLVMIYWVYGLLFYPQTWEVTRLTPKPVPKGDQEIAWLHPATNAPVWERFITGLRVKAAENPLWGLEIDETQAYPDQTADVPMIAMRRKNVAGTLWLRWYKITSQQDIDYWVKALMTRAPAPLVIVGGGSSDRARDLAWSMAQASPRLPDPPLLFITTATADEVATPDGQRSPLMQIYPGRTFRFCFSNRQMAEAITHFIWGQEELRPNSDQVFLMSYQDDPYSKDLVEQFRKIMRLEHRPELLEPSLQQALNLWQEEIPYSIGPLSEPNRSEAEIVERFVEHALGQEGRNALLVLPADPKPARRVLRSIFRSAPVLAPRLVVTAGDTIDFDTLYRDRHLAWPIQDLPCRLVLFCHHNPILASAGFVEEQNLAQPGFQSTTGTQNVLLYGDLGAMLIQGAAMSERWVERPSQLAESLHLTEDWLGRKRFDAHGHRHGGAGEFIVLLEPIRLSDRVYPKANLAVYERNEEPTWRLVDRFEVYYGVKLLPQEGSTR